MTELPPVRGVLTPHRPVDDLTWLRVGGPADYLFQPADEADLAGFLGALDPGVAVFPMGVGSNLIVRDGGIRAVVVRLGRGFNAIACEGETVVAGAAALDAACGAAGGGGGAGSDVSAHHPGGDRRGGADERGVLWGLREGSSGFGARGDAGGARW